jgi:hypothetical protein
MILTDTSRPCKLREAGACTTYVNYLVNHRFCHKKAGAKVRINLKVKKQKGKKVKKLNKFWFFARLFVPLHPIYQGVLTIVG